MRSGSTSVRMSTFPVNEHEKWVSCDEQKGNLALSFVVFFFVSSCFFNRQSIFHIFSCSHGTCLAGVTEPLTPVGHGTSASTEMWSPFTPPDGHAQTHRRSTNAGTTSFTRAEKLGYSVKFNALPKKYNHNTDSPLNLKFILEFDAVWLRASSRPMTGCDNSDSSTSRPCMSNLEELCFGSWPRRRRVMKNGSWSEMIWAEFNWACFSWTLLAKAAPIS